MEAEIVCPWCKKAFVIDPKKFNTIPLIEEHIKGCKERNQGIEMWCPKCMSDMKFRAADASQVRCKTCGNGLTCKCGKPATHICSCGILTCDDHKCPKSCDRYRLKEGLLEGLKPYNSA